MKKIMLSFMLIVLLSCATLGGTDLDFPRVGATYRIQYSEVSTMQNMPEMVTVLGRGPGGWCLVEYESPKRNIARPVHQTWLNFDLIAAADEEMLDLPKNKIENTEKPIAEKPTGIYP